MIIIFMILLFNSPALVFLFYFISLPSNPHIVSCLCYFMYSIPPLPFTLLFG